MSAEVFVDTNVLVYARDAAEGRKQRLAADWLEELWATRRGRTSMQVLGEYYVTMTRKLTPGLEPDEAWDDVLAFLNWRPPPTDRDLLVRARDVERRYRISWWDAMIVGSAQAQNCTLLLSEDLQDGLVCGGVVVRSPFTLEVGEAPPEYAGLPEPVPRHRPRGRPRRSPGGVRTRP